MYLTLMVISLSYSLYKEPWGDSFFFTQERSSRILFENFYLLNMSIVMGMFKGLKEKAGLSLNQNSHPKKDSSSHPPKVQNLPQTKKGVSLPRIPSMKHRGKK